jgi:hypothetical protein
MALQNTLEAGSVTKDVLKTHLVVRDRILEARVDDRRLEAVR